MILSTRLSVRIADLYFEEQPPAIKADILRFNQSSRPIPGAICTPFSTLVIDLTVSSDELLARMNSHHRQKIRRALKDDFTYEYCRTGDKTAIERFVDHFDRCAELKNLQPASRARMEILAQHDALDLSFVLHGGKILAACCAIVTPARVRGLYVANGFRSAGHSAPRTLVGRAGRYLYWRDILRYKESGAVAYDLGGYYTGDTDTERLLVNRFKEGFGGELRHEFNCEIDLTFKGKMLGWAIRQRNERVRRKRQANDVAGSSQEHEYESAVPTAV
jgi:lipid II:glycine glycyltransferase (peptidoglycan interpeptide bridge formation enzyme)